MNRKTRSKKEIADHYDRIFLQHGLREDEHCYKLVISILGDLEGKTLLDVACGEGILLREAENKGTNTFGLDISEETLKKARINSPRSRLALSEGERICFNFKFDYVTCLGSLEHFGSPEAGCREIAGLLKDNGKAVILLPNQFSMHRFLDILFKGGPQDKGFQIIEREASFNEWKDFLEQNQLKVLKAFKHDQVPVFFKDGKVRSLRKFFKKSFLYFLTPFYFARNFIFVCERKR